MALITAGPADGEFAKALAAEGAAMRIVLTQNYGVQLANVSVDGVAVTEGRPIAGALDATGTGVATPAVGGNCGRTGIRRSRRGGCGAGTGTKTISQCAYVGETGRRQSA
jgi:hypothetical protein